MNKIGPEFVNHKHNINNRLIKSSIWDTAGQERYRGINKTYYREAKGAILISDLSNVQDEKSFERWLAEFKEHADSNSQVIVVGNKLDLVAEKKTEEFLENFSKKHGLQFFKMSAKTGENVQAVMMELIKLIDATYFKDPVMNFEYISRRSEYRSLKSRVSLSRNSLLHTDLNKEKGCCKSG